ncbi:UvrB/UvrC motif-containing protein, partial [bacterium]|nr:UvrB/UvrC motif-containing protein [bacterium]
INLLREGLDLPEVSLVAILDADKEGFLRSERSLMQVSGRAARNINGNVIFYGDNITKSMAKVIEEVNRRRKIQFDYNQMHGITPKTIYKSVEDVMSATTVADIRPGGFSGEKVSASDQFRNKMDQSELLELLNREMLKAAEALEFEKAAELRDEITRLTGSKKSILNKMV